MDPQSFDDMRTGCYDIHDRVKDMNANGMLGSMCFPSFPQFCGQLFARAALKDDADLALALVQAYNDWHIEAWCGAYPGRFIPLAIPMMWDVDKMAAEVRRVAEKGCFAVTFSENPVHLGHPSIHSGHWDPFFATCEELGTVVNVHIGSSSKMVITAADAPMDVLITLSPINIVQAAADFVWSTVPKKFPKLQVRAQRGRHRLDSLLPRAHRLHVRPPPLLDRPGPAATACRARSSTSRSSAAGSTTRSASRCAHKMNVDMICWECDYPHSDSTLAAVARARSGSRCRRRTAPTRTSTRSRTRTRCALFKYDPFSVLGGVRTAPSARCAQQAEGWDVSIVARGIKASGTGAADLGKLSSVARRLTPDVRPVRREGGRRDRARSRRQRRRYSPASSGSVTSRSARGSSAPRSTCARSS